MCYAESTMQTQPYTVPITFETPIDIALSLAPFSRNGDDGLDRWDGTTLIRTVHHGDRIIPYALTEASFGPTITVTLIIPAHEDVPIVLAAVHALFIEPPPISWVDLLVRDPRMAALDARFPALRTVRQPDLLTALVRSISAQQVNLRWAATIRRRLAERFGTEHHLGSWSVWSLDSERLASAQVEAIRALQWTTRKAEYVIGCARAIASGTLDGVALRTRPTSEIIATLMEIRGIGRWTAEWIAARTYGRPVVVAGDLGVRKAVGALYLDHTADGGPPSEEEVRAATAHWGDAANTAQTLALHGHYVSTILPTGE